MRQLVNINEGWSFLKDTKEIPATLPADWEVVNVPHTWNNIDGMDGGSDYFRGTCNYAKIIKKADLPEADCYYLEINGAASSADVYVNGKAMAHHDGGFSTWRVDITAELTDETLVVVAVDNAANNKVYPQVADFTFYGGMYRDVNIIAVANSHFDLDYYGGKGLVITPAVEGEDAKVKVETYITNKTDAHKVHVVLKDAEGNTVAGEISDETTVELEIKGVHRWHGRKDPYLYTCEVELLDGDTVVDVVSSRFGCRTYEIDPQNGFILNGEEYPLRGVSRHQDRIGFGNALLKEHHDEDMDLICEVGATTIRLAHYQHDQYFYDLCDERGMVIWAEIPYISSHMATGRENTISQMKELVVQNYNHPSIVVWGLSNEITINGHDDPDLIENHRILNDLVHDMDKTRLTTMAIVSMCPVDAEYIQIPDTVSWNHYFGWYGGTTDQNGPWFDKFHAKFPNLPVGVSEYGCEALNWHNSDPKQGDYSEEYQAYYHEELIKQLYTRKYLWATHVWNMFDFGADSRGEGGENGQNHKGLVTIDRKYKKDSFYAYKAWLSDDPFVHLCGKRYVNRVEDVIKVTVYSNQPEVELFANGVSLGKKTAEDHFFYFDVPNAGETKLEAVAGEYRDESVINKVDTFDESYRLVEKNAILNWFDITEREGYCSLNTTINDIMGTFRGKLFIAGMTKDLMKQMKKNQSSDGENKGGGFNIDFKSDGIMQMVGSFTILRISSMGGMVGIEFTKEQLLDMNKKLNKIPLPKKK
ncbi:MAG: glycoside hydrolase family 2 protein [Agathobacter sp.]|nr:glycoside hydrolase family 2 protein [Agathobacter sp.]